MRSAETSGVGAGGFGRVFGQIAPLTYAVALTAFLAASLFVVADCARTFAEMAERDMLLARLGAVQPLLGRQFVATAFDPELVLPAPDDAVAALVRRGGIAYGLAFLFAVAALRRRQRAPDGAAGDHADLLASIRAEQRLLARRYHEEKLRAEAASRSKTAFLAHLSHDIRTPLNHIIGFAELMRQETYGPLGNERYAGYVDSIRVSGERLLGFFATTLELAELEGGSRVLDAQPLDVDELLRTVVARFSPPARRKRVVLASGAPCRAVLMGDRFSLERALGNLVDNAIRFTPARGRVSVTAHAASDGVVLEVTDTGIGMSPERLAAVSQPFALGDAALTRDHEGAGLGLAIARTITELSGGRLAIDSRPGLGTTVAVSLPLPAAAAEISRAA